MFQGKNILLGVTGGIAAYKVASLIRLLVKAGASVKVVMTPASKEFITPLTLSTLSKNPVYSEFSNNDTGEWNSHVELGLWADLFLIAPATANTIAKMAGGICDNLLLATYFSAKCPVFICPAMDLDMYLHPTVKNNLNRIKQHGNKIIYAKNGELASGLTGEGRMEEPEEILSVVQDFFSNNLPLSNKKILITSGPTYEQIDPVRFIGNNSSGKMGVELAKKAVELGASVRLVIGPSHLETPSNIDRINVRSAKDMYEKVNECFDAADIVIMAAAVSDFTPKKVVSSKIKKKDNPLSLELEPTKDILRMLGHSKSKNQLLIGFALETDNEEENALKKLKAKKLDLIILNSLQDKGAGFSYDTNKVTIIDKHNNIDYFELKTKSEVASDIFDKILTMIQ